MAGDWIKLRTDLHTDPAVIRVGCAVNLDAFAVVGRITALWSWADAHTADGNALGVTSAWVDLFVRCEGFAAAMSAAGWLVITTEGITFPHFDRHNGKTAKARALTAKRVAAHKRGGNAGTVTPSVTPSVSSALPREEKRREEEEKTPLPPAKPGGGGEDVPATIPFEHIDTNLWEPFLAAWDAARLPGAGKVHRSPNRVGLLQQRLADKRWRESWREAIARAGRSLKCRGMDSTWPSGLRLDTFLKDPDMLTRVLEGEFDDASAALTIAAPEVSYEERQRRAEAMYEDEQRQLREQQDQARKAG